MTTPIKNTTTKTVNIDQLTSSAEKISIAAAAINNNLTQLILKEISRLPKEKADLFSNCYEIHAKIMKGYLDGFLFETATKIEKESYAEFYVFCERIGAACTVSKIFHEILLPKISIVTPAIQKALDDFSRKNIVDFGTSGISQSYVQGFYLDPEFIRNSDLLNKPIIINSIDLLKFQVHLKRSEFINNLFNQLNVHKTYKDIIRRMNAPEMPKSVMFLSFLNNAKLQLIDVKLNAIEDPVYEKKIQEDFRRYLESFSMLQPRKKSTISESDKMAAMLEALKDELDSPPASASSTPPKAKKTIPTKASAPCAPLDQNLYQTPTKPARERIEEPLLKVRPMSKKEAQSPDWQPVEAAKKQLEVTPAKMLQKILSSKFEVEPKDRILRWMNVTDLNSIKLFQDMSLEGQGKKLVKRYERMSDEELYKQALRHCVPSIVLPILSNPNFVESYCFQKNRCYFAKVKIVMPSSRFCEETILSFAINDQNQIYHWFIHPQEEIEFEKELSDIPKEPDVEFEKHPQAARSAYAGERLEGIALENKNLLGISINYLHPINRNPMQLIIFPRK